MEPNDILKFIGQIVLYGGGSAAIAFAIFALLGKGLVESWFSKSLKGYEYQINSLFNRVTKIHEKEFEVLPQAWGKLQDALGQVGQIASPLQSYPDFTWMSETEFQEFLETTKLRKHEKEKLSTAPDKNKFYQEKIFWHELHDAKSRISDLHNFLIYNKIFLSKDLFEEFSKIDTILFDTISEIESNHESREHKSIYPIWKRLNSETQEISKKIENLVQIRLHYPEA